MNVLSKKAKTRFAHGIGSAHRKSIYFRRTCSFPSTGGLGVSTPTLDGIIPPPRPAAISFLPVRLAGSELHLKSYPPQARTCNPARTVQRKTSFRTESAE